MMIAFCVTLLYFDSASDPYFPRFLGLALAVCLLAGREMLTLLDAKTACPRGPTLFFIFLLVAGNWLPHTGWLPPFAKFDSWKVTGALFVYACLGAWLLEMARFQSPGQSTLRIALPILIFFYLGILPSFLIQLRWLRGADGSYLAGLLALGVTIAVTKGADIGAYFTGRIFGKHRMSPTLSPKKTWEGLAGGLVLSSLLGWAWFRLFPQTPFCCDGMAAAFGFCTGLAGVFGDLGESLLKRDANLKDASNTVPEFGGILDILDSLLFAGPIAWLFFLW
ncbi:MAG: hypothetical protein EXR99_10420 [Gemmataceae bacterium]|nr:hypothetical protein [Gemmataceae bacterium]